MKSRDHPDSYLYADVPDDRQLEAVWRESPGDNANPSHRGETCRKAWADGKGLGEILRFRPDRRKVEGWRTGRAADRKARSL